MSANTVILVAKYHDEYYVWYDSGNWEERFIPTNEDDYKKFPTRAEALLHAHDLDNEERTEYGVQEYDYDAAYERSLWKIPVPHPLEVQDLLVINPKEHVIVRVERNNEIIYSLDIGWVEKTA